MNDEKVGLLRNEATKRCDSAASEVRLHLDEGCQTEMPKPPHEQKPTSNTCFYIMSAVCFAILLIPLIVYLEKRY
jgi:hypothetical protein